MTKGPKQPAARAEGAVAVPAAFAPIVEALSFEPGVTLEKGWGSSSVVLKARGKIFVMLVADELVLKLPKARVDALVRAGTSRRFDPRRDGRVMKEWVVVSTPRAGWTDLAREALKFVSGSQAETSSSRRSR
jgi:hypothetical protein